jgi:GT2 family glycosyltransferase
LHTYATVLKTCKPVDKNKASRRHPLHRRISERRDPFPSAPGAGPNLGKHLLQRDLCLELIPVRGVEVTNGRFNSTGREPWLKLDRFEQSIKTGAFIEISYRGGLTDVVSRPVLRFWTGAESFQDSILPAPSLGRGLWRGRAPKQVTAVWVSPTRASGLFSFEIENIRPLTLLERARNCRSAPKRAFYAISAAAVGLQEESSLNFRWMLGQAAEQDYADWRAAHAIAPEPLGDAAFAPVVVYLQATDENAICASFESLARQTYRNWRLAVIDPSTPPKALPSDPRVFRYKDLADAPVQADSFALLLAAGDELEPFALDCLIHEFARQPNLSIVYADHLQKLRDGRPEPVLKPDWSPLRQAHAPYVGRAVMIPSRLLRSDLFPAERFSPDGFVDSLLARVEERGVGHVGRPLFILAGETALSPRHFRALSGRQEKISIIVPSRDRKDLLDACIRSIFERTTYPDYEVVIVDNGSIEPETKRLYETFEREFTGLSIVEAPGPFNFSRLCNLGASHSVGAFLVFLNNDTEVLQENWLENLLDLARQPETGAVGANLLYPDGCLQHAGVVLGFGGVAGHFEEGAAADFPGWLRGLQAPREVSAVTAACLMVERRKFEAVSGFDEFNLPVELNDIDLCLRLSARGWGAVCDGRTRLRHHCSASRGGRRIRLQRVYEKERTYFRNKWFHLIRDDPFFNPNLSLYCHRPSWG